MKRGQQDRTTSLRKSDLYYTDPLLLDEIASKLCDTVRSAETWQRLFYVDFSCGDDAFASRLRDLVPKQEFRNKSFDIEPICNNSNNNNDVQKKSWFDVSEADMQHDKDECFAIGLNPPFGYQGCLAKKFVAHALSFRPDILVLILPSIPGLKFPNYVLREKAFLDQPHFYHRDDYIDKELKKIPLYYYMLERSESQCCYEDKPKVGGRVRDLPSGVVMRRTGVVDRETKTTVVIRRCGVNAGKQAYLVLPGDSEVLYYTEAEGWKRRHWSENKHVVEASDKDLAFFHIEFDPSSAFVRGAELVEFLVRRMPQTASEIVPSLNKHCLALHLKEFLKLE
jgi:hypothetical protein